MSGKEIKSNFIQNIQSSPYNFLTVFSFSSGVCFLVSVDSCILLHRVNYLNFTIHSATFLKELVSHFFFFQMSFRVNQQVPFLVSSWGHRKSQTQGRCSLGRLGWNPKRVEANTPVSLTSTPGSIFGHMEGPCEVSPRSGG